MFSKDKILLIIPIICVAIYYGVQEFAGINSDEYPTELIFLVIPISVIAMSSSIGVQTKIVLITPFAILAGYNIIEIYLPEYTNEARLAFLVIPVVAIFFNGSENTRIKNDVEPKKYE